MDRDSEIVAPIFDERSAAIKKGIARVITVCRAKKRKIGSADRRPATTLRSSISSSSRASTASPSNPDTLVKTTAAILEKEQAVH